ncbi:cilia- and flagella-associated protein 184 [Mantella aurantiaca]
METPEPGTREEDTDTHGAQAGSGQETGTEPGATDQETDRERGTSRETGRDHGTSEETGRDHGTSEESGRDHGTSEETGRDHGTSEETGREHGTSEETGREHGTSEETGREHGTSEETGLQPYLAGTTNQEINQDHASNEETGKQPDIAGESTTNQESGTIKVTAGEPGKTNQETDGEQTSNQEGGTIEEPGAANQGTQGEHAINQEGGTIEEPGAANQGTQAEHAIRQEGGNTEEIAGEPGPIETTGGEVGAEGERTDIDQENTSSEHQKEEFSGTKLSPDTAALGITPEEELKVTDGGDNEGLGTARYQETLSEPPEEQGDPQYQHEAREKEESEPQEGHEQWGQDMEPQDSSTEDKEVREALIQQYHALVSEKEKVQQRNSQLQHKLYEYFRRKKGEETRQETEKHVSDQEQRYLRYLAMLEEMRNKVKSDTILHEQQIEELRLQCQNVVSQVDKEWAAFQEQKKKIALYVVSRGAGKHAASSFAQEMLQLQAKEERKAKEVIQVRLENIKFKNQINHHESTLRSKEELAEGLHLIDFEQLKIENQTYNEKIEERNEELLKLRKKITNTVQVLTHLKEKLQFVQNENQEQKDRLMEIEALVAHKRDILTRTKQARDSLRMNNLSLKQKCGLLGNKTLLRDFEEKVDATEELSQKLENLKRRHAELTLSSKGVMKKIEDTKVIIDG